MQDEEVIDAMTQRAIQHVRIWGESAVPFLLCIALRVEPGNSVLSEDIVLRALQSIVTIND